MTSCLPLWIVYAFQIESTLYGKNLLQGGFFPFRDYSHLEGRQIKKNGRVASPKNVPIHLMASANN